METKLSEYIKENTISGEYEKNSALVVGKVLGFSRNWVSQNLNDYYNTGALIKINSRPVLFLDKEVISKQYNTSLPKNIFGSIEELMEFLEVEDKKDFQTLNGYDGSLRGVVETCKASISYPPNGLPTLLYGQTGTGKSLIARKIYEYGINQSILKKDAEFVHVNCSEYANNPELLTAYLFGYKKGAFTGADHDNPGLIHQADGGVLFLDEVHCLKPECQEKLFLFMDNGSYRQIGDNENVYHSNVFLVFATTEDPKKALLKTLLRRIPIQIHIPSLEQRGLKEKADLIVYLLECESKQIQKEIRISSLAYQTLLNTVFEGNVGELENCIRQTCMTALFMNKNKEYIEINNLHLPNTLNFANRTISFMEHHVLTIDQLKEESKKDTDKTVLKEVDKWTVKLQNNEILIDEYFDHIYLHVNKQINQILFSDQSELYASNINIIDSLKAIIEMVNQKYRCNLKDKDINVICMYLVDYFSNYSTYSKLSTDSYDVFIGLIKKYYANEYKLVSAMNELIESHLNLYVNEFFLSCLTLYLSKALTLSEQQQRVGVILAHGYATASSIASSVNEMLGHYVFEAIDMPLDTTTDQILVKLKSFIDRYTKIKDLILLVDMGSLEKIYDHLSRTTDFNIAIANNVSTKFALFVGEGIIKNEPLKHIFDESIGMLDTNYKITERKEKEKIILCSCATGIGTAEKLKEILEDSLPEKIPVKVLTYDYSTLVKNQLESDFFDRYEVICIIGTLDPKIPNLKFVSLENFIMNESFDFLWTYFEGMITPAEMNQFQQNLLKNFSLTNIIMSLTFLNPDKLLEYVADSLNVLQREMNVVFSNNICFGLYVHICCLIERLVLKEGIDVYTKSIDDCSLLFKDFYYQLKESFQKVEKYYRIDIPVEEAEYIYMYINNMKESQSNEDDE